MSPRGALGAWLGERAYVRQVLATAEEPRPLAWPPPPKVGLGLFLVGMSYVICWPVILTVGFVGAKVGRPGVAVVAGPFIWGFSHLVWMAGMALIGVEAARKTRWLWRMLVRAAALRLGVQGENHSSRAGADSTSKSRSASE